MAKTPVRSVDRAQGNGCASSQRYQRRQIAGVARLSAARDRVLQHLFDAHGVHLAAVVVAGLDGLLDVTSGDLRGERIGDHVAGALFLLHPCMAGHGDPHRTAADVKPDIDSVGVARRDGDDVPDPAAVQIRAGPAVLT